jgi:short-subunit dehydrogenase
MEGAGHEENVAHNILITGATSGIGRALALQYAASGVTLGLLGRDPARLAETVHGAEMRGARVRSAAIDLRDRAAMQDFLLDFDAFAPIDRVIATAGVTGVSPGAGEVEDLTQAGALFEVNLGGLMNTLAPIAPPMRARRSGQIVLFSSLAAFAPPPDSPSYAASKAAVLAFGLATRALYRADGVSVSVVCPGFVDTPMTASYTSWKPMLMSPDEAARRIRRGLERRKAVIAFPLPLYWGARLQGLLPEPLRASLMLHFRAFAR